MFIHDAPAVDRALLAVQGARMHPLARALLAMYLADQVPIGMLEVFRGIVLLAQALMAGDGGLRDASAAALDEREVGYHVLVALDALLAGNYDEAMRQLALVRPRE